MRVTFDFWSSGGGSSEQHKHKVQKHSTMHGAHSESGICQVYADSKNVMAIYGPLPQCVKI